MTLYKNGEATILTFDQLVELGKQLQAQGYGDGKQSNLCNPETWAAVLACPWYQEQHQAWLETNAEPRIAEIRSTIEDLEPSHSSGAQSGAPL